MQNENNHLHWKQKLGDTELLSAAHPFDKTAAWSKVKQRLQTKPKRRKAVWYWAAAASVLPFLFWLFLPTHQPYDNLVKNKKIVHTHAKPIIKNEPMQQTEAITVNAAQPITKKKKEKGNTSMALAEPNKVQPQPAASLDSATQPTVAVFAPKDTNSSIATASTLPVRKLKVVHINELNEPVELAPVMVRDHYIFSLQIARGESYTEDIKATQTTSFINLKRKPTIN